MEPIAHIKRTSDNNFEIQTLEDHLSGTAILAASFASEFSNADWGHAIGLWHDLGKYSDEFQNYIKSNSGYEEDDQIKSKTDHTSAGAIFANQLYPPPLGQIFAYCIAGHHAGLHNYYPEIGFSGDLAGRLQKVDLANKTKGKIPEKIFLTSTLTPPTGKSIPPEQIHLWIRMLFSCLVDADFLDTENFMNPEVHVKRQGYCTLVELREQLQNYLLNLARKAPDTTVNQVRQRVLSDCLKSGQYEPGFFSLTVPTGGGKTLSSLAWALEHACRYQKKRIIIAIPYTSIISQTARVYRDIFGNDNILEHHSNLDDKLFTQDRKLAAENWDAPIVVTTNVQLFESLFSNRTSQCRKLHNLVNSIIILDEAQMLPTDFLQPIISVLKGLVGHFGVSVMFSTATQPVLDGRIGGTGKNTFDGLAKGNVREISSDVNDLSKKLRRVEISMPEDLNKPVDWLDLANELVGYEQVLCVVNTRKQCRTLYERMPSDTIHLSRMMCSAHLIDSIELIKDRLKQKQPVRVISTQLIEAGVDIDFPVVYRALAGLDSIAQCAGRCNREGNLNLSGQLGKTTVFIPPLAAPPGLLRKAADISKELISNHYGKHIDWLSSEAYSLFFNLFFSRVDQFDKADIKYNLQKVDNQLRIQFATAAQKFRLIDDKNAQTLIVTYKEGADLIQLLRRKGPEPWLMRKLQRFSVTVNERDFTALHKERHIEEIHGCMVQSDPRLYDLKRGVVLNNEWIEEVFIL